MRLALFAATILALSACSIPDVPATSSAAGGGTMFVANKRGASLSRIDLASGEETHRARTCENPHELTTSPDRSMVLVACYSGRELEVYRTADLSRAGSVQLGEDARVHSALWLEDGAIVAGAEGRGSLYLIEGLINRGVPSPVRTVQEIGGRGPGPHLLAVSPDRGTAWGTIIPTGEVVRYDLEGGKVAARRRVGEATEAIALSPDGADLWVASNTDSAAYLLDPETLEIRAEVKTGEVPIRLAMHPSGDFVVSSNYGTGNLTVIDTATKDVVRTIPVSGSSDAAQVTLVFSMDGKRLYAAETATDTIAEIDFASGRLLRRIATGPGGDGLAVVD